jgi:hypothetical protein
MARYFAILAYRIVQSRREISVEIVFANMPKEIYVHKWGTKTPHARVLL